MICVQNGWCNLLFSLSGYRTWEIRLCAFMWITMLLCQSSTLFMFRIILYCGNKSKYTKIYFNNAIETIYIYINMRRFECNVVSQFQSNGWRTFIALKSTTNKHLHFYFYRFGCKFFLKCIETFVYDSTKAIPTQNWTHNSLHRKYIQNKTLWLKYCFHATYLQNLKLGA